ncbi:30S ribosomal protein S12 methylthiotransferase RimO [Acidipila sp. EB88]|uniref:30S ribosomal protein S12 methylthiotransferase RimO n=1 Tax=Acidipila sp. EB88 TaxID=2305226 RepID=UPI000F5E63CA|nr:30S ribosomal protein S12 methylthiotransferase RimO [Acidipila sp. EB88]RRA50127.1 30S ribosomal protein S12 methylthiotransferase RimO [Acidipila sp. EB88]
MLAGAPPSAPVAQEPPTAAGAEPRALKIGFVSLGCPKNLVDSEVMMGMLQQAGAELTTDTEQADVLVVNTCSFIDSAKQESVDTILEMAGHKVAAGGRAQKLIVAGCLVERYRDEIRKNIPEVDAVVGTGELEGILLAAGLRKPVMQTAAVASSPFQILGSTSAAAVASLPTAVVIPAAESTVSSPAYENAPAVVASRPEGDLREQQGRFDRGAWDGAETSALPTYLYTDETPRLLATGRTSAYIKIAEGCDHPCTFCVIPNLRGKFRSRRLESIVVEAERLIASGVRELTLIGQDTTCYGEDLGLRDGLAMLLDRLAGLEGLVWLRFLYTYPNRITTRLLETMAKHAKICPYLDVPLQHASPAVLKNMRRGGGAEIFLRTLEKARSIVPDLAVRTGFIVGFPGETDEDFQVLKQFVREARFDWMGVFSYSDEEGAKAFDFGEKVPRRTIEARRRSLMKLQQGVSKAGKQGWVGRQVEVLVEGESEETPLLWEGRSAFHAPEIDGKLYLNDFGDHSMLVPGTFYTCEITEAHDYDVVARVL